MRVVMLAQSQLWSRVCCRLSSLTQLSAGHEVSSNELSACYLLNVVSRRMLLPTLPSLPCFFAAHAWVLHACLRARVSGHPSEGHMLRVSRQRREGGQRAGIRRHASRRAGGGRQASAAGWVARSQKRLDGWADFLAGWRVCMHK